MLSGKNLSLCAAGKNWGLPVRYRLFPTWSGVNGGPENQRMIDPVALSRSAVLGCAANFLSPGWLGRALLLGLVCLLAACSKLPIMPAKPDPTRVGIRLNAAATVNVDARGRSMPVVVRTYLLKNASAFEAADFFSLFERDKQVLGEAMMVREEVALIPGQTRTLDLVEVEGGRVVAVFAAFREIDRAVWRASVPLVANRTNQIVVTLQDNRVELSSSLGSAFLPVLPLPTSVAKPALPALALPGSIEAPAMPAVPTVPAIPAVPAVGLPASAVPAVSITTPSVPAVSITTPSVPTVSIPTPAIPTPSVSTPAWPFSIPVR